MTRGSLRVFLGAAPGVGKTYAMLEEGHRLSAEGADVVVGIVETHGRSATARVLEGLVCVPRRASAHRGVELTEMDVEAILERAPDVVLVDELAHTDAPGGRHEKRWQDVDELLGAGIDVWSTVNIQHIESLNDVVVKITGVPQHESIPDAVLRRAAQIELVDLAPQALRGRLAQGVVYPAARVDAALSNYFRLGNLTALRELALLWLADEVDNALTAYRTAEGISSTWEARERVVVALLGGAEGETLLRRGARIAARSSGGDLYAVHVAGSDGLVDGDPAALAAQRVLVDKLGGTYHQVVGDDPATALVEFARSVNATQLVIGASSRGRLSRMLTGEGNGQAVIRNSGDIDVHVVTHPGAASFALPKVGGALSVRRRLEGFALALAGLPSLTWLLSSARSPDSLTSDVLAYQLLVVVVALVGGFWPALVAAVASGVLLDYFFVEPLHTITVQRPLHALALIIFVIVGSLVSLVVDQGARRLRRARRSAAESETLSTLAGSVLRGDGVAALVDRMREVFGLAEVAVERGGRVIHRSTEPPAAATRAGRVDDVVETVLELGRDGRLVLTGPILAATDRRVLTAFASQIEAALAHRDLEEAADRARPLEAADRMRTALLAAVGHDLRTPLSAATAAVSSLGASDVTWTDRERDELINTAEVSLDRLGRLVNDLLDASRLQAGVLAVSAGRTALEEVLPLALDDAGAAPGSIIVVLPDDLPDIEADPVLLQRIVANLVSNALRHSPEDARPRLTASAFAERVQIRIVDAGSGIPEDRRDAVFEPFQREGDTDGTAGVGLGLALSRGFAEAMDGSLEAEDTPGGGLTMVVSLPLAARDRTAGIPSVDSR